MLNQTINQTANQTNPQIFSSEVESSFINSISDFLLYHAITLIVLITIAATILVNNFGSKKNLQITQNTKKIIQGFLAKNFTNFTGELINEAPHIIKMYASGRQSCIFAIFAFALIPRHQILSLFLNPIFFNVKDELVIEIPIKTSLALTLAIVRKKNIRQITKKKYPDIKTLCKQYKPAQKTVFNVPETHAILVEKKQHVNLILATQKQVEVWNQYAKLVKLMYLSDINKFSRYPMALRMVINLSDEDLAKNQGQGILSLLEWTMTFVDRISKTRQSVVDKRQAKKKRQGIDDVYDQF